MAGQIPPPLLRRAFQGQGFFVFDQPIDKGVDVAVHRLLQAVYCEADPMISYPALREIVGPDTF